MLPINKQLREQIKINIKNKIDISTLIQDRDIRNEDLSRAIIKKLNRLDTDISGCNFSQCILGDEDSPNVEFSLIRCKIENCNFDGANFIGKSFIRSCNAKNCNFRNSNVVNVSYENTDFTGSTFCGIAMRLDSRSGMGCKFPESLIQELCKYWNK
jgi:uncharacterized protein YjbI with pentapeptide repeats